MDRIIISNWVRQARHRAKKHNTYSCITVVEIKTIVDEFNDQCVFCTVPAVTLDCLFPLCIGVPNVPANVVPICHACKVLKRNHDIVWLLNNNHLTNERYLYILKTMFTFPGGELLKDYVRRLIGVSYE